MLDGKEPTLSRALSVAVVLGTGPVNAILALIGYGGAKPLDEGGILDVGNLIAGCLADITVLAAAAADGRIDHTEEPACRAAADQLIERLLPISSSGQAS